MLIAPLLVAPSCSAKPNGRLVNSNLCRPSTASIGRRVQPPSLLGGIAQNSFQGGVEIAPHLRHALIAILAKERRRLIIFKNSPALFAIGFDLLYAFIIVRLDRRELVWINVTTNPTAEWIARQITEAFPWDDVGGESKS